MLAMAWMNCFNNFQLTFCWIFLIYFWLYIYISVMQGRYLFLSRDTTHTLSEAFSVGLESLVVCLCIQSLSQGVVYTSSSSASSNVYRLSLYVELYTCYLLVRNWTIRRDFFSNVAFLGSDCYFDGYCLLDVAGFCNATTMQPLYTDGSEHSYGLCYMSPLKPCWI